MLSTNNSNSSFFFILMSHYGKFTDEWWCQQRREGLQDMAAYDSITISTVSISSGKTGPAFSLLFVCQIISPSSLLSSCDALLSLYPHWVLIINQASPPHLSAFSLLPSISPPPSHPAWLKTNQSKPRRAVLGKPGRPDEQPFIKKITKLKLHFSI